MMRPFVFIRKTRGLTPRGLTQHQDNKMAASLGQVHLRIEFHPDLDESITSRHRGLSIASLDYTPDSEMHDSDYQSLDSIPDTEMPAVLERQSSERRDA